MHSFGAAISLGCFFFFIHCDQDGKPHGLTSLLLWKVAMESRASGSTPAHTESSYRSWLHTASLLCLHRRVKDRLPVCVVFEKSG